MSSIGRSFLRCPLEREITADGVSFWAARWQTLHRMRPTANPSRLHRRVASLGVVSLLMAVLPVQSAFGASSQSLQKELDRLAAEYGKVETQLANTEAKQAALTKEQQEAQAIIDSKSAALRSRAGYMYKSGGATTMLGQLLTSADFGEFIKRVHYMGVLGGDDARLMEELTVAQTRSNQVAAELEATEARQSKLAKTLDSQKDAVQGRLAEAK